MGTRPRRRCAGTLRRPPRVGWTRGLGGGIHHRKTGRGGQCRLEGLPPLRQDPDDRIEVGRGRATRPTNGTPSASGCGKTLVYKYVSAPGTVHGAAIDDVVYVLAAPVRTLGDLGEAGLAIDRSLKTLHTTTEPMEYAGS